MELGNHQCPAEALFRDWLDSSEWKGKREYEW